MKIQQFSPKYADEMAQLFVDLYSDDEKQWDLPTAKAYLAKNYEGFPEINFMAIDENGMREWVSNKPTGQSTK